MGTAGFYIVGFIISFVLYGIITKSWGMAFLAALMWPLLIAYIFLSLFYGAGKYL